MQKILAAILTLFTAIFSLAQEYRYKNYDVENGLSNNRVNCIYKDTRGLVWIGTPSGLNRFDGYDFKSYFSVKSDTTSLSGNYIESIQEDAAGNLLIGCGDTYVLYNRKLDRFVRNVNARFKEWHGEDIYPTRFYIDTNHTIWAYDPSRGLYYVKAGEKKAKKVADKSGLLRRCDISDVAQIEQTICFVNKNGEIIAIDENRHNIVWSNSALRHGHPTFTQQTYTVYADSQNRLWINSVDGIWVFDCNLRTWDNALTQTLAGLKIVRAVTQDNNGNIWIGQDQVGLSILNPQSGAFLTLSEEQCLANKTIASLYTDNDGNVWIGSDKKGLYQYNENMFKFFLHDFPDVNCIADASNNVAWIGTDSGALIAWNRNTGQSITHPGTKAIACLCADNTGGVWIGTYRGGLRHFTGSNFVDYNVSNGLASNNVWSIVKDARGCLWLGTLGGGLQYFNPADGKFVTYNTSNSKLPDNFVNTLYLSKSGDLYIGTTQGVTVMNVQTHKMSNKLGTNDGAKSFSVPNIVQLLEDSRGLLWVATPDGLYVYDKRTDKVQQISLSATRPNSYVLGLTEDLQGEMWATIGSNIVKIQIDDESQPDAVTFHTHTYTHSDGLQPGDFNQRSFCRMSSGEILVGGLYGVNTFIPHLIKHDRRAPKVLFLDISLFNQPVRVGESYDGMVVLEQSLIDGATINLKHSQNEFTIYFTTDSHLIPEKTVYRYRLTGFNSDWQECQGNLHQVTYTNLTPGTYTLEVKAVNNDGTESKEVATLQIVIRPPFWLTGWAKTLYVLLALLAVYYVVRTIKRRERRKYAEQKKAEAAKQEEALAQMKFRFFTNISHELRTPLTLILSPLEAMLSEIKDAKQLGRLQIMHNNANRLLYLVNQLLDFRKNEQAGLKFLPIEGDVVQFVKNICDNFSGYSENKNVQLTFTGDTDRLSMLFDSDKLSKIIINLLSNAFKFTADGGRVDVLLSTSGGNLIIKVADTGIGIPDSEKARIFERFYQTDSSASSGSGIGLSLVNEYVKLHDGAVNVIDNEGGGSVFVVTIPIRHKDAEQAEQPTEADATQAPTSEKPIVMVVDDNVDLLTFIRGELTPTYTVVTAANGRLALEEMRSTMPDIIITDIMMPEMDGIELCRRLKADSKYSAIPVIVLSAKHDEQSKVEGLTIGADDYITKPFNCDVLNLRIRKLLQLSHKGVQRHLIEPEPAPIQVTSLDEKLIEAAVKYVEKNMSRTDLSVEEMSRELGMSRVHLYKRLRQITGKTPIEFIRVMRLKRAAQLLRESQLNVSEIAYRVGFNNPKYFSNYFKQEFGVLPSVYQDREGK
jgi:signal transduction histidine kinase/ligand-binding sensor domain-containing protein/DNA-binding response OmpR family regulator